MNGDQNKAGNWRAGDRRQPFRQEKQRGLGTVNHDVRETEKEPPQRGKEDAPRRQSRQEQQQRPL